MLKPTQPDLFIYEDFHVYLRDRVAFERSRKRGFSYRNFAKASGFGSSGYLKMVIDGQRNLGSQAITAINRAFNHSRRESAYFEALVLCNQAKIDKDKQFYQDKLNTLRPKTKQKLLDQAKYDYFTKSHFVVIREMVALPNFKEDPKWIAERIKPSIKPDVAEETINKLMVLGLLSRNEQGKLVQSDAIVSTPPDIAAKEIYQYHVQMLNLANKALFEGDPHMRDITAVTLPIPRELIPQVKELIQDFRQNLLDIVNSANQPFSEVFQVNIQCFPVTQQETK